MNRALQNPTMSRSRLVFACLPMLVAPILLLTTSAIATEGDKLFSPTINSTSNPHAIQNETGGQYVAIVKPDFLDGTALTSGDMDTFVDNAADGFPLVLYTSDAILSRFDEDLDAIDAASHQLDYLLMDLEPGGESATEEQITDIVTHVRDNNNYEGFFDDTKFGNFNYFAATNDDFDYYYNPNISGDLKDKRNAVHDYYADEENELTVAMPRLYVDSFLIHHADEIEVGGISAWTVTSPTQRSGLFWAPLELFSEAKRMLPQDHELIPSVTDFEFRSESGEEGHDWIPTEGQGPTLKDNAASITHYRLRGADGVMVFGGYSLGEPGYDESNATSDADGKSKYRQQVADGWTAVDPLFEHPGEKRFLNAARDSADNGTDTIDFATNKAGGVEWSAAQKGNRVMAVITNLSETDASAADLLGWTDRFQLPTELPQDVPDGEHALLQYRTHYLDYNDNEQYATTDTMDTHGWQGPAPASYNVAAASGANPTNTVVSTASGILETWHTTDKPGFSSTDVVVYSAWLYLNTSTVGFGPANTTDPSPSGDLPDAAEQGPKFLIQGDDFIIRKTFSSSGPDYAAVNFTAEDDTWYEVQMVVDPNDGANGTAKTYVRDVTSGQRDFTLLVFDDTTTTGTEEHNWKIPLILGSNRETVDFDGWIVRSSGGAGNAIDNLNMGYYVPKLNDNFEHYALSTAMNSQTVPWNGTTDSHGPSVWYPAAPLSSSGNASSTTAGISIGASDASAWWQTENPDFLPTDHTVFSAKIFGLGSGGGPGDEISFAPVYTSGTASDALVGNSQIGFEVGMFDGAFQFILPGGNTYEATNLSADSDAWYDIQVQIDQTADEGDGIARLWVKNLTDDDPAVLLEFDNLGTGGDPEELLTLPLALTASNSPLVWDGWQVFASNEDVQIDSLRSFLFPYTDFDAYNLYIDDPDFGTADRAQLAFIPEPASLMLLSLATSLLLRRRT